ncbi:unnamed protein product, partial [marine sediment metagenome]
MNCKLSTIINQENGFTFIEVIIASLTLLVIISAIAQYHSNTGASNYQIYDLKAVETLKSEAEKLETFFKGDINTNDDEFNTVSPPSNIFLFKYNTSGNIDVPANIHNVYYKNYETDGFTISIGDDNSIDNYHANYINTFNPKYTALTSTQKKFRDLRTYTYCNYDSSEDPSYDTDYNVGSLQIDTCMVVIDDMGSPEEPEDDLLGYIGWWVEDINGITKIT